MGRAVRIALALLLFASGLVQAASLERFQSFVRSTQSARGEFEQRVFDRNRKLLQTSKGTFVFQRPGRFRWTYSAPHEQLIVGDGTRVWIYDKELNQVSVRRLATALGSTPAALLAGSPGIEKAFEFTQAGEREGLQWLEAKPREREAGFERIRLGFGATGVDAMELVDHFNQTTVLRFSNYIRNPEVDATAFRFTPPPGADVLGER